MSLPLPASTTSQDNNFLLRWGGTDVAGGVAVIRRLLEEGRAGYDSFS